VFFDGVGHVGMYIGGGRFIHAPHSGTRVSVASLNGWYGARYDGARRFL
jgi:cell wall-associated NlpC family hydrolase